MAKIPEIDVKNIRVKSTKKLEPEPIKKTKKQSIKRKPRKFPRDSKVIVDEDKPAKITNIENKTIKNRAKKIEVNNVTRIKSKKEDVNEPIDKKLKSEINKELNRLNSIIKRAEKRGYINESGYYKSEYTQENLDYLKSITTNDVYNKLSYTDENGDLISGDLRRKQERQQAYKKGKEQKQEYVEQADVIISNFQDIVDLYLGSYQRVINLKRKTGYYYEREYFVNMWETVKSQTDKRELAKRLQSMPDRIERAERFFFDSDNISMFMSNFEALISMIKGETLSADELLKVGGITDEEDDSGYIIED